jgi:hypothetical protein
MPGERLPRGFPPAAPISQASLAYFLEALIPTALTLHSPLRWAGMSLSFLAVPLVRSAWQEVAVGVAHVGAGAAPLIAALLGPVFGDDSGIASPTRVITPVHALTHASVNSLIGEIGMIFWASVAVIVATRKQHQSLPSVFRG